MRVSCERRDQQRSVTIIAWYSMHSAKLEHSGPDGISPSRRSRPGSNVGPYRNDASRAGRLAARRASSRLARMGLHPRSEDLPKNANAPMKPSRCVRIVSSLRISPLRTDSRQLVSKIYWWQSAKNGIMREPEWREPTGFVWFALAGGGNVWVDVNRRIIQNYPHGEDPM